MGHVTIDDVSFTAQAGDTYLLWQGTHQNYFSDKKNPWEKHWVNLSGAYVLRLAQSFGISGVSHFPNVNIQDLLLQLQGIAQHAEREDAHEKCVAILSKIFLRLSESLHPTQKKPRSAVQSILLYIERHETESIRIEELAALCQKSPSQIERLFSAEMGIPIYRYILNRKIELAKQLLLETGMTVREIAAFLSFEDEFYFSGLFRRKTGYSPTQYRAISREQASNASS
jgi:AraC-like DNA-binding protein